MTAIGNGLYKVLVWAVTGLLMVLTVVVSYQVAGRYLSFIPRALWTEEIARFCLEWMVFLGAAVVLRRSEHFIIDIIPGRIMEKHRKLIQIGILVFLLLTAAIMIYGGLQFAQTGLGRKSTTSGLVLFWGFLAIPVSGMAMVVFIIELAYRSLRGENLEEFGTELAIETAVTSMEHEIMAADDPDKLDRIIGEQAKRLLESDTPDESGGDAVERILDADADADAEADADTPVSGADARAADADADAGPTTEEPK